VTDLPRGGSYEGWEQVAEVRDLFEAELIALRLREAGMEAEVLDQSFRQEPLPDVRSFAVVRVLVRREELARAREVLATGAWLAEDLTDEPGGEDVERPEAQDADTPGTTADKERKGR
jgi:hypothetical protein